MSQPSQQIAARYQLHLSDAWQQWFDEDANRLHLPGGFRTPLTAEQLVRDAPAEIWAGFMLPDTLPLVGNQYGDWICVRICPDGGLGELVHWYHGGGDWIPLGSHMAEVVVHDVVDHFRPIGGQMLRGAPESIEPQQRSRVLAAFAESQLREWLVQRLMVRPEEQTSVWYGATQTLEIIEKLLEEDHYVWALHHMGQKGWAQDAVACDLIQHALQAALRQEKVDLADRAIARQLKMKWVPDYVRWLFDLAQIPIDMRERLQEIVRVRIEPWEGQDWSMAEGLARGVLLRRQDLGWAVNVAGWSQQRRGGQAEAAAIYFQGRHASAFSDQGVRMRTHWSDSRYGKFATAQLAELFAYLTPEQQADSYLHAINGNAEGSTIKSVQEYWMHESRRLSQIQNFGGSYAAVFRAGWDMGVGNLADYRAVLEALVASAAAAGWHARQAVAQTHLNCLLAAQSRQY